MVILAVVCFMRVSGIQFNVDTHTVCLSTDSKVNIVYIVDTFEPERGREIYRERACFFLLQGYCFSKSAWGETAAPRLPEAFGRLLIATPSSSAPISEVHDGILPLPPLLFSSCRPHVLCWSSHPHRFKWQSCQGTVRGH